MDLLNSRTQLELSHDPGLLEAKIGSLSRGSWICIDEVQKIPVLLNEVHRLIEEQGYRFVLSGSSARKLRRGGADLLAGRAITKEMGPFSYKELGDRFDLKTAIEWGTLPLVFLDPKQAADILSAYVHTYIKEEIKEEGLVRRAEPFLRFLEVSGLMNGQLLNKENIARDAKIPRATVDTYFSILEDTLLGHFLPPFRPQAKVREQSHPKFYWFDPGVARGAAGLLYEPAERVWLGTALETLIHHELRTYNHAFGKNRKLSFYRTSTGAEIDFVIETKKRTQTQKTHVVCVEVKYSERWDRSWEAPSRSLMESKKLIVDKMFGVYCGKERYQFDRFQVLPVTKFLDGLYEGAIF